MQAVNCLAKYFWMGHISGMRTRKTPGERLREWRDRKGWTQAEACEHLGISMWMLSNFECGNRVPLKLETLTKIRDATGIQMEDWAYES
jgi:transcriptional regulator with XRE-family HTH domain